MHYTWTQQNMPHLTIPTSIPRSPVLTPRSLNCIRHPTRTTSHFYLTLHQLPLNSMFPSIVYIACHDEPRINSLLCLATFCFFVYVLNQRLVPEWELPHHHRQCVRHPPTCSDETTGYVTDLMMTFDFSSWLLMTSLAVNLSVGASLFIKQNIWMTIDSAL